MAEFNTAFGVLPSPKTQLFGSNAGDGTGGGASGFLTPSAAQPSSQPSGGAASTAQRPPTFSQMQQQGQARPAPPSEGGWYSGASPYALGQSFQAGAMSQGLLGNLMQQLNTMQQGPSAYDNPAFAAQRQAAMANLQAQRGAQEQQLTEEMARRGLSASSISAGRMGDIAGQYARAQADLESNLMVKAMEQEQQRQQFLTQQLGQLFGQVSGQELGAFQANIQSAQAQADINARAAELQQNERLKGRELDLQAARDQATKEYQSGQLALGYAEMGSRERVAANELASREKLQQQAQEFQAGQNAKDRALREAIQLSETTGKQYIVDDRGNVVPKLDANGRQMETSAAEQSRLSREQQASQFSATQAAADKDRALREAMAMSESTGLQYTVGPDGRVTQVLKDGKPVPTSAAEQARLSREQQANQFTATQAAAEKDRLFRESVARSEQTGFQHTVDDRGNVVPVRDKDGNMVPTAQSQQNKTAFLAQLSAILAPLTKEQRDAYIRNLPEDIRKALGLGSPSSPGGTPGQDTGGDGI